VYDDFGLLRYILPPKLEKTLTVGNTYTYSSIKNLCFYNEYDKYHNITSQYLPGVDEPVVKLYDKKGRAVLSQNGELRKSNSWSFVKYDIYNRPVITGICTGSESAHRSALKAQLIFHESTGGSIHGYTNNSYPKVSDVNSCLKIVYYDNYSFPGASNYGFNTSEALSEVKSNKITGNVTAEKVKVLGSASNQWLMSVYHYNKDYELIQSVSDLYPLGKEIVSTQYDFTGNILESRVKQSVNGLTSAFNKYYSYDGRGVLKSVSQKIEGDNLNKRVKLAEFTYDELGRVQHKKIHNGAETLVYAYDIQGRVTSCSSPKFNYNLAYDQTGGFSTATPFYGGNVSYMSWQNGGNAQRAYVYEYDQLNQLRKADFHEKSGSSWSNQAKYDVTNLSYDDNGNIKSLTRKNSSGDLLHNFSYAYNGNKLTQINGSNYYAYDANGNMSYDGRKGISVAYNVLSLPQKISKGSQSISYIYSADGKKLAMGYGSSVIYYRGGMIYHGNALDKIIHEEGQVVKSSGGYSYYYALKDHLGSTRVLCKGRGSSLTTEQTTEYYPFGLAYSYSNLDKNSYLYSGKEYLSEVVDGTNLSLYDFGSRLYDVEIGRWNAVDPALQLVNPYGYCANNPVRYVDPDGEFFLEAILIGAAMNTFMQAASGNINNAGDFFKSMAIGAASGAAGFGAGQLVSGTLGGFAGGFLTGAAGGFAGGFVGGAGNGLLLDNQKFDQALMFGMKSGIRAGAAGGLIGGVIGGIDAFKEGNNFWNGDDVRIGRNQFSLNNKPVPEDELFYVREDGKTYPVKQINSSESKRINPRFYSNDGTYDKVCHNLTLEDNANAHSSVSVKIPGSRITGNVGIETGKYYYPKDGGIRFSSNSGLNKVVTTGPTKFSFPSNNLKLINANIFGTPFNNDVNYGTFIFKIIVRIKP
jgi:RHS repeat-associated protein